MKSFIYFILEKKNRKICKSEELNSIQLDTQIIDEFYVVLLCILSESGGFCYLFQIGCVCVG